LVAAASGVTVVCAALAWWLWIRPNVVGPIDPQRYRSEIRDVERRLYRPAPAPEGERVRIEQAVGALVRRVRRNWPCVGAAGRLLAALSDYEAKAAGHGEEHYQPPDLPTLRADWEALRAQHLGTALWFSASTAELDEAQLWFEKRISIIDNQQYETVLIQLEAVVNQASAFLDSMPEFVGQPGEHNDLCKSWGGWGMDSRLNLKALRSNLPASPTDAGRHWRQVHSSLQDALRVAETLLYDNRANTCGLPSRAEGRQRIEAARQALSLTRFSLAAAHAQDQAGER
jgi:hypothetical protein